MMNCDSAIRGFSQRETRVGESKGAGTDVVDAGARGDLSG